MRFALIFVFLSNIFWGHTRTRINNGYSEVKISWPGSSPTIQFRLITPSIPDGSSISASDFESIYLQSQQYWNNSDSGVTLVHEGNYTATSDVSNDIFFDSDFDLGSDVIAVTKVRAYDTGEIVEADIHLNPSIYFTTNENQTGETVMGQTAIFLGDLLTHEIGHSIGLGHTESYRSSMFYAAAKGQYTPESDDKSGARSIYSPSNWGQIMGTVAGSNQSLGILGAKVSAISILTGEIAASAISDSNGNFYLEGLDLDDTYYLYVAPVKNLSSLPNFFNTAKTNFCTNENNYRGGFYSGCSFNRKGRPFGISLTSSNSEVDVGVISIHCGLEVPDGYRQDGDKNIFNLDMSLNSGNIRAEWVGYFLNSQILDNNNAPYTNHYDQFEVDISQIESLTDFSPGDEYYLQITPVTNTLFSDIDFEISKISGAGANTFETEALFYDSNSGELNFDRIHRIRIDGLASNQKSLVFNMIPRYPKDKYSITNLNNILVNYTSYVDNLKFYFLSVSLVKKNSDNEFELTNNLTPIVLEDEASCLDGPNSYEVQGNTRLISSVSFTEEDEENKSSTGASCATIDTGSGPGQGGSMLLGLFLIIIVFRSRKTHKIQQLT